MSEENVDALPLTSVELLDAAVWREIGSEEAQPAAAFLEALSRLVGRWLMVRSDAPGTDVVTGAVQGKGLYRPTVSGKMKGRRMPKHSGQTELTIREQDRRVLMLAAIDLRAEWHAGDCGFDSV
jgi:hypothetical protein